MNNLIQSECEREIKKITRTIIILITLNICPIYAGNGHFKRPIRLSPRKFLAGSNGFWPRKVILGVSVCTYYELVIWCTVPFSVFYNIIGRVHFIKRNALLQDLKFKSCIEPK